MEMEGLEEEKVFFSVGEPPSYPPPYMPLHFMRDK